MELLLLIVVGAIGTVVFAYVERRDGDAVRGPVSAPLGGGPARDLVNVEPRERPVAGEDLDYLEFFGLARDLTAAEAERLIAIDPRTEIRPERKGESQ